MESNLFLILKSEYYWQIFRKKKSIEYRACSKRNISMIKNQKTVTFQLGYSKENRMKLKVVMIEKLETEFRIHLDLSDIHIVSLKLTDKRQLNLFN